MRTRRDEWGWVGLGRNPPHFLRPGDVCEVENEGIGTLTNTSMAS